MNQFVTDTHTFIWHLTSDRRLSPSARQIFDDADKGLVQILIPGIVLIEMVYLVEKDVLLRTRLEQVLTFLDVPGVSYIVAALDEHVARAMLDEVAWSDVPELADRIIAATAVSLNLPLLSKDPRHRSAGAVQVVW